MTGANQNQFGSNASSIVHTYTNTIVNQSQAYISRYSRKSSMIGSLKDLFVSSKSGNLTKMGAQETEQHLNALRRQRSELTIDRGSHSLAPIKSLNHLSLNMQNRLEVPRVVRATPAAFQK